MKRAEPLDAEAKDSGPAPELSTGGRPRSPGETPERDPKNRLATTAPPKSAEERLQPPADPRDRWGDLPQRARDVFTTQGAGDMPSQYRTWIDGYYRRLNRAP